MARRYYKPMSEKGGAMFCLIGGLVFIAITVFLAIHFLTMEIPEDVQWYEGKVNRIISEREYYKKKSNSNSRKRVYDCEVSVGYIVNGEIYEYIADFNDRAKPVDIGDVFYLQVSPSDPDHVYAFSTTPSSSNIGLYLAIGLMGVGGVVFFVAGICQLKKLKNKKQSIPVGQYNDFNSVDMNSYDYDTSYNTDFNTNYNTNYNTMDGQTSNYGGTTIDKLD